MIASGWFALVQDAGEHSFSHLLGVLVALIIATKLFGGIAQRLGQPSVLGELIAGVILGGSVLGLLDPADPVIAAFAEIGVLVLLFQIGLHTDLKGLIKVGTNATVVASIGVAVPFALGFFVTRALGIDTVPALVAGAALTATSVGISARVLSDLGRLQTAEGQIVLGAAVLDDIIGLVILSVVAGIVAGGAVTVGSVAWITVVALGFVVVALVVGRIAIPPLFAIVGMGAAAGTLGLLALAFAFTLAWLADAAGSALIIGAFAAGLVLATTERRVDIEHEVHDVAQFFIPIFFVMVGAAVDLKQLNPFDPATRQFLIIGVLLTVVAILGKLVAGYAAFGRPLRKFVIGVGMVPRGEVGLIFAQLGLSAGLLSSGLYSSVALMVIVTTFLTPPVLRALLVKRQQEEMSTVAELVTETMADKDD